jgi:hypothetical protein
LVVKGGIIKLSINKASVEYTPTKGDVIDTVYALYHGKIIAEKQFYINNNLEVINISK